ncbi:solute carrier family 2, facilitated glucose transporter member 11-like [Brachionichthys hirsutus]|uniref:solute carrier family 2, facilitated glucose transporter member 11-like n=1 Tax=Brachionichthys hirsutus TaxID=412623 RepID=UPI0036049103
MGCKLKKMQYWRLYLLVLVLGIGGTFQYGLQISITSSSAAHFQKFINETWILRYEVPVEDSASQLIWSFIVAILSIGAIVGAICNGWLTVHIGRKKTLLINNIVGVVAALLVVFSRLADSFEMILVGRFLFGFNFANGINTHVMYIVESSPRQLRALLILTCSIFLAFGKVVGQILSIRQLLGREPLWQYLLAVGAIPAIIQFVGLLFFPEAPRYLYINKGDSDGAIKALQWLWQEDDLKIELEDMEKDKENSQGQINKSVKDVFTSQCVRWQLLMLIIPCGANQLCGFNALYFYAFDIFHESGVQEDQIHYFSIGIGIIEFSTVTLSLLYIDRAGRRNLMGYGYLLMAVAMSVLTGTLSYKHINSTIPNVNIGLIFCTIAIYGLGPAAVRGVLPSELFLQAWRSSAFVIIGTVSWASLFLVGISFGYIVDGLGQYCFLIFVAYCVFSGVFVLYFLPETKRKTIVEITEDFQKLNFKNRVSDDNATVNVTTVSASIDSESIDTKSTNTKSIDSESIDTKSTYAKSDDTEY